MNNKITYKTQSEKKPKQAPSAVDLLSVEKDQRNEKTYKFIFCTGEHRSKDCESAGNLVSPKRKRWLKNTTFVISV